MDGLFPRLTDDEGIRIRDGAPFPRIAELADRAGDTPFLNPRAMTPPAVKLRARMVKPDVADLTADELQKEWEMLSEAAQNYGKSFAVPQGETPPPFEEMSRSQKETAVAFGKAYQNRMLPTPA